MKKVLLIGNCYRSVFRFRKELIIEFVKRQYEVWTAFPNGAHGEKERGEEAARELGCHFQELNLERRSANVFKEIQVYFSIERLIKSINPDIILTFTIKPNIFGGLVAKKRGIPYVINITGLGSGFSKEGFLKKALVYLQIKSMETAKCVFFQNSSDLEFFKSNGFKGNNYERIPGSGVNLAEYRALPYENGKMSFLYLSRIMKEKGINFYLQLAELYKDNSDIEFHVCGEIEEDYVSIMKDLNDKKVIIYHGMVNDIQTYLGKCSAIIYPSYYNEGISNSLLEAAASARPIITTNHPGCRDVVDDGVNGFLFDKNEFNGLKNCVDRFIRLSYDERLKMGVASREKVEREFDRNTVIEKYMEYIG